MRPSDGPNWNRGRHNLRFGADAQLTRNNTYPLKIRGSFTFTGVAQQRQPNGIMEPDTTSPTFARPSSADNGAWRSHVQISRKPWDVYVQDDWRFRGNLTVNLGLRYDYASPYTEASNKIVNIDVSPGFTAAVAVLPGSTGGLSGIVFPKSLVKPDRNNVAPRVGIAYRLKDRTVIRAGYGLTYNGAAYAQIAAQMANQPPFHCPDEYQCVVASHSDEWFSSVRLP